MKLLFAILFVAFFASFACSFFADSFFLLCCFWQRTVRYFYIDYQLVADVFLKGYLLGIMYQLHFLSWWANQACFSFLLFFLCLSSKCFVSFFFFFLCLLNFNMIDPFNYIIIISKLVDFISPLTHAWSAGMVYVFFGSWENVIIATVKNLITKNTYTVVNRLISLL